MVNFLCDNVCVLPIEFYRQPSLELARNLLGCELVNRSAEGETSGIIVETEAYHQEDEASHSFGGRQTKRNSVMFGPAGRAYIYFTYGMHFCFNVVAGENGVAEAVLIRAIKPQKGTQLMMRRRKSQDPFNLSNGPAKLVQAMGISIDQNGQSLLSSSLFIKAGQHYSDSQISVSPRIGISKAIDKPWRFFVKDSDYTTKHKYNRSVV